VAGIGIVRRRAAFPGHMRRFSRFLRLASVHIIWRESPSQRLWILSVAVVGAIGLRQIFGTPLLITTKYGSFYIALWWLLFLAITLPYAIWQMSTAWAESAEPDVRFGDAAEVHERMFRVRVLNSSDVPANAWLRCLRIVTAKGEPVPTKNVPASDAAIEGQN
jgi:hypothetical protein